MPAATISSDEVRLLREEIAQLRAQIAWLKKRLFGPGQSETLDRAQLVLQLGALEKLATRACRHEMEAHLKAQRMWTAAK